MHLRTSLALLSLVTALALPALPQIQEQKVAASDAPVFGSVWDFGGAGWTTAVVGARGDNASGQIVGAAYVFERRGSRWQQTQKMLPSSPFFGMRFGASVGIADDWIAVGASGELSSTGAVYVFRRQGGSFLQHQKITASDPATHTQFGVSLALTSDRLIVGAHQASTTALTSRSHRRSRRSARSSLARTATFRCGIATPQAPAAHRRTYPTPCA